jgi:hypothetical protein
MLGYNIELGLKFLPFAELMFRSINTDANLRSFLIDLEIYSKDKSTLISQKRIESQQDFG